MAHPHGVPDLPIPTRRRARRQAGPAIATLIALAALTGLCALPRWDGRGTRDLTPDEQAAALLSPLVTPEARRAAVLAVQRTAIEAVELLHAVKGGTDPDSEDARRALRNIREALDR